MDEQMDRLRTLCLPVWPGYGIKIEYLRIVISIQWKLVSAGKIRKTTQSKR